MNFKLFSISLFIALLTQVSCVNNNKTIAVKDKLNTVSIIGSYVGDLPCVDCESINTVLYLGGDNLYKLAYVYEGKSEDQFVKEGVWSVEKDYLILKGVDYKYKIDIDGLVQLDLSGQEIRGDLADKYLLHKMK